MKWGIPVTGRIAEKLALAFYPFIRWEKCIVPFGIIKIVWLFLSKIL